MKAFKLIKILPYGILLFSLVLFSGCSGNPMATSPEEIEEGIQNGEYVKLSRSASNQITRGKNVFETVIKKYQPVIDFYGADSEVFQKMVNTNLMMNADSLTSPSEKMFNYDAMSLWEDTEIVVEYEDGTREALPAAEALTIDGVNNPDWYRNGKKVVGYLVKLKKAEEIVSKIANRTAELSEKVKEFEALSSDLNKLSETLKNSEQLASLCSTLVTIGKWAGYAGAALNIIQMTGVIDMGPSENEVINMKLDYIIEMIQGIYTHLEYIETRLTEIETVVKDNYNKEIRLNLATIKDIVEGTIEEIASVPNIETRKTFAEEFLVNINGHLESYINNSQIDYANFIEWQTQVDKTNPEYLPLSVQINTPHQRNYSWTPVNVKIDCTLSSFTMINPNALLPFSFEGLDYFKHIVMTRMNINSYVETDSVKLEEWNSNSALNYLNNSEKYISGLRSRVLQAYAILKQELADTKNNINGPSTGVWSETEHFTVKDNLNSINLRLNENLIQCAEMINHDPESGNTFRPNRPPYGIYGSADKWSYTPLFSSTINNQKYYSITIFGSYSEIDNYFTANLFCKKFANNYVVSYTMENGWGVKLHTYNYEHVTHTYLYSPSITLGANSPVEFVKGMTDVTFLDDANSTIDAYYKAKTNKLLEFAASLAALEIQLAMYLDDEDYAVYAQ